MGCIFPLLIKTGHSSVFRVVTGSGLMPVGTILIAYSSNIYLANVKSLP